MVAAKRGAKSPRRASKGTPSKGEPIPGLVGPVGPEHGLNQFGGVFGRDHIPGVTGMDGIEGVTTELSSAPIPTYTYVIVYGTLIGSVVMLIALVYYAELAGLAGF